MLQPNVTAPEDPPPESVPRTEPDDASVIRLSLTEPDDFAILFRRHAPLIGRYVARRVGPDPVDDIVSETFLAAFRQRGSYDLSRPDARPWLYGIATNLVRRHQRSEVRMLRALERTGVDPVSESFTDRVDGRLVADAVGRRLAAAIATLPAAHRDVLLLITWAELSYDEAAVALGIAPGTVRSRMNRVRRRLRKILGDIDPTTAHEEADR